MSGVKQQPWWALIHAQAQLRRSSTQPLFKPLVSLFEKACQLSASLMILRLPLSTRFAGMNNSS
jgi:hypothetical protein